MTVPTVKAPRAKAPELDAACAEAVDLARAAAEGRADVAGVGDHLGVVAEGARVATHYFEVLHPGYTGWRWAVSVARASRARVVTVSEVVMLPGEGALVAPAWVPWSDRIQAGDVGPGVLMPTSDNDPRVEAGFTGGDTARDADPAEWAATRAVVAELGLGRERVLSVYGRDEAADRWVEGEGGPHNAMTKQAPGNCLDCAYFVRLTGSLGRQFGVCANEFSQRDAQVVTVDHGCGAHSDVVEPQRGVDLPRPVWDTITTDDLLFD
ncbi:DUF3027 domain-containing protein [Propioniciclava sp. MC1595]|uniref:DUF3027 domain-containing protein n=1 Tax=unclassified Propioniciclava TaxID=2642922 RepID=UPI0015FFC817|nr:MULTISPECIES: DUF3027 domain-containing protein [unclassified Propioniciclava]MBB1494893.1 DUF3027 domain-containing protein [Propioniciclava sp. MC1595]MBB1501396.1 DUF3027 domain-containing protein [Propioniciclava sp. MC1683]NLE18867.1 DUF3027 domain-containing protein [Propioniciclava sp.]QTE25514.1 DUF3027 domain-containing protein [Propioniciclava sp. MC1595]